MSGSFTLAHVANTLSHHGIIVDIGPYKSSDDAVSALSDAIIAWARSQPHPAALSTSLVHADLTAR